MFQYIVRDLVTVTNVSNAAILFDDSFFMNDDHYTNLLIHMPVRHVINKVKFEVKVSLMLEVQAVLYFLKNLEHWWSKGKDFKAQRSRA